MSMPLHNVLVPYQWNTSFTVQMSVVAGCWKMVSLGAGCSESNDNKQTTSCTTRWAGFGLQQSFVLAFMKPFMKLLKRVSRICLGRQKYQGVVYTLVAD